MPMKERKKKKKNVERGENVDNQRLFLQCFLLYERTNFYHTMTDFDAPWGKKNRLETLGEGGGKERECW